MNLENLKKVKPFADKYKRADGTKGVSPAYIYKVYKAAVKAGKEEELGWRIINIAGYNCIEEI